MGYEWFDLLVAIGVVGFFFGVVYPVAAIICYPIYRLLGGRDSFGEYVRNL